MVSEIYECTKIWTSAGYDPLTTYDVLKYLKGILIYTKHNTLDYKLVVVTPRSQGTVYFDVNFYTIFYI